MSHSASTPSAFKRVFVGADAAYAAQVPENDIFHVAGPYGPILRVGSTTTEDYVIWTGTANTSFGELDVGANLDNYFTISGAASGSSPLISAVGTTDSNVGIGLLPEGNYMTTTTRMLIGPQSSWAAAQTSNATRLRTQLAAFHNSFVNVSGQEFYPQFSVTAGSQSGPVDTGSRHGYSVMGVDNDNLVTVAGGSGPEGLAMLYVGLGAGNANGAAGGAHAGGRNGVDANIFINSDVDVGAGTIYHVALAGNTTAYRRMGGVPGEHRGNVFGSLLAARGQNLGGTGPGPRYLTSIVGLEVDVEQQANVSALWKMGTQIVEEKDSATNALQQNIGLLIANQPSATTIGWNQGISFGGYNGQWPIASNGQVIATLPTPIGISTFDAADGLNLRRVTFSRAAIETPGLFVDGSGNLGGQTVGGLALQTVSAINAKVSTVSSVTVVEGGVFDGPTLISTTGTYSSGSTAVTVASFAGISNGMIIAGTDFTPGTTVVSGAGTVNLVVSANTLGAGTGAAITFVTANPKPTFTIASPATSGGVSGTTATMTVATMGAAGFSGISTGGNGLYVAGETLTAVGGTGTAFTVYIETVTAGTPTNIRVASAGSYTVLPTNPVSFTGSAAGTGYTAAMLWTILTVSNTAGTNYNELRPPAVTFIGTMTQTREARFKLNMSAGTAATLALNHGADLTATGKILASTSSSITTLEGLRSVYTPVWFHNNIVYAGAMAPRFSVTGALAGTITGSNFAVADFTASSDNVDASSSGGLSYLYVGANAGGSVFQGNRTGVTGKVYVSTAATNQDSFRFITGGSFGGYASVNPGTGVGYGYDETDGYLFGGLLQARAQTGARFVRQAVGLELNVGNEEALVPVLDMGGIQVVMENNDVGPWMRQANAYGFANQTAWSGQGWAIGFAWQQSNGQFGLNRTYGAVLGGTDTQYGSAPETAFGVDFGSLILTRAGYRGPSSNAIIDGSGNIGGQVVAGTTLQTRSSVVAYTCGVNAITVVDGSLFLTKPTLTVAAPPGGGTQATASINTMAAAYMRALTGGTGYAVNDTITLSGGTSTTAAVFTVAEVVAGVPKRLTLTTAGSYTVLPAAPITTTTSGAGTGLTMSVWWTALTVSVTAAGDSYPQYPLPHVTAAYTLTGGDRSPLRRMEFAVTMTATQAQLQLNNGKINVTGIPTSSAGLSAGDLWSNAGILTVV